MRVSLVTKALACLVVVGVLLGQNAHANPDGAPWGSADPASPTNCSGCHFDGEAISGSPSIVLDGLPSRVTPGEIYELVLRIEERPSGATGFLVSASAGAFQSEGAAAETQSNEIRSVAPNTGAAKWRFEWRAPKAQSEPITFRVGVNASNDDQSPFGDQIHFRTFVIEP